MFQVYKWCSVKFRCYQATFFYSSSSSSPPSLSPSPFDCLQPSLDPIASPLLSNCLHFPLNAFVFKWLQLSVVQLLGISD